MPVNIKNASLEKVTYKIMSGETEIAVGWVAESDGFIAIYQVSTGEHLIGEPEWIDESQVQARTPLYDITNVEEALRNNLWKKPYLERFSNADAMGLFQKEYCNLPAPVDDSGEYHKNPALERVKLSRVEVEQDRFGKWLDSMVVDSDLPENAIFKGIIRRRGSK